MMSMAWIGQAAYRYCCGIPGGNRAHSTAMGNEQGDWAGWGYVHLVDARAAARALSDPAWRLRVREKGD